MSKKPRKRKSKKTNPDPTGVHEIDRLADLPACTIQDYVTGVSAYVRQASKLDEGPKKAAQIRLSHALARSLADEVSHRVPRLRNRLVTQEQKVAGGLRTTNADVSESHNLDGLRLAVELKPINLAVGRAIWNRFGDIRTFAVNIHLKFPFAVVGGVLVIPTYEEKGSKAAELAETEETSADAGATPNEEPPPEDSRAPERIEKKSTVHLIERAIERLVRAGGRDSEASPPHLLEGIAVVVYDPDTAMIHKEIPKLGSGLRWEEFIEAIVVSYRARFED